MQLFNGKLIPYITNAVECDTFILVETEDSRKLLTDYVSKCEEYIIVNDNENTIIYIDELDACYIIGQNTIEVEDKSNVTCEEVIEPTRDITLEGSDVFKD